MCYYSTICPSHVNVDHNNICLAIQFSNYVLFGASMLEDGTSDIVISLIYHQK